MTRDESLAAAAVLRTGYFGGFGAKIGDAFGVADSTNQAVLLAAFADLFARAHALRVELERTS